MAVAGEFSRWKVESLGKLDREELRPDRLRPAFGKRQQKPLGGCRSERLFGYRANASDALLVEVIGRRSTRVAAARSTTIVRSG